MKKLVFLGAMVMIVGGVALASSLTVPFFNDAGGLGLPPASGVASYIGLVNNTSADIVCWVTYTGVAGDDFTPDNNTFLLKAKSGIGFRPVADDTIEGDDSGRLVPNMVVTAPKNPAAEKWGSARITWTGGEPTDVQGRLLQSQAASVADTATYTLPEGK